MFQKIIIIILAALVVLFCVILGVRADDKERTDSAYRQCVVDLEAARNKNQSLGSELDSAIKTIAGLESIKRKLDQTIREQRIIIDGFESAIATSLELTKGIRSDNIDAQKRLEELRNGISN